MHTQRIKVLHVADRDAVVELISDDLCRISVSARRRRDVNASRIAATVWSGSAQTRRRDHPHHQKMATSRVGRSKGRRCHTSYSTSFQPSIDFSISNCGETASAFVASVLNSSASWQMPLPNRRSERRARHQRVAHFLARGQGLLDGIRRDTINRAPLFLNTCS